MPSGRLIGVVEWLRHIATPCAEANAADSHLLQRFVTQRDGAAFDALVRRHGPLVWGVCRRLLPQASDADDAFQATFLVLARRAGSITKRASVRSWLYGTALRVATRLRSDSSKRGKREQPLPETELAGAAPDVEGQDLRLVLDEEIGRLPAHERLAVILCFLEGKTHEETAQELGCPRGTVGARLSRARERLRRQLTRRGITLSAVALTTVFSQREAQALSPPLIRSMVEAVNSTAVGELVETGAISPQVQALTEGVIQAMIVNRKQIVTAILLAVAMLGATAGALAFGILSGVPRPGLDQDPAQAEKGKPRPAEAPAVAELAKERLQAARDVDNFLRVQFRAGQVSAKEIAEWSPHLLDAELDVATTPAERRAALKSHVERLTDNEKQAKRRMEVGQGNTSDYARVRCFRLEAELRLAKEKAK